MRELRIVFIIGVAAAAMCYVDDVVIVRGIAVAAFILSYIVARWVGGKDVPVDPVQPEPIKSLDLAQSELESEASGAPPPPR